MESVKRREIISGRRRQVRPPPDRGRGSRNCAVPAVLPPGLVPFGNVCISLAPPRCYFAASSTADLSLLLYIRYILYLHTHCTHLLLRAILLLLLGASAAAVRVFFFTFRFRRFLLLELLRYEIAAAAGAANFIRSLSLPFFISLSSFLTPSLVRTARLSWYLCASPLTQKRVCACVRSLSLTQAHSLKERAGLLLVSFQPLVAPTDCCCWSS